MGGGSRGLMGPLLLVNLVMYVLVLALAGWSLDKYIDRQTHRRKCSINSARGSQLSELQFSLNFVCCADLGGNMSTEYLLIFALLAGAVGACSVLAGTMHLRAWRSDSLASAVSAGLVSWALTALSFGCVTNISLLSIPTALNSDRNTNHRPRMQADHSGESRAASGKANQAHAIFFFFRKPKLLNKSHQYKQLISQRTLEAFIVILTFTQLLYLMLLCAGAVSSSYGPSCRNSGGGSGGSDYRVVSREQRETTAAANAPPHA
uniref:Uncharacterized protein n=1 Tax=Ananas comosus var. bracteatus TaxID=296719 RepID=A0A6V7P6S5_ANACO|nr:unnamed protein product [Ananas comosus var. bracteatus]